MDHAPSFVAEIAAQIELARSQQREARSRGDEGDAEVAEGRIADLQELLAGSAEPLAPTC
ncbi:hypothetical protein [Kineococcus glutinatus]|uniref:Uncharacterized protein n=1 Tax=Kineococcus glutinatus TaxID=1070872 RepID=A0ABP8VEQ7_9ACTN